MTYYTELKRLAEAMKGWDLLTECWPCGENGPDWQVGQVDEDDNRYPVMTIDTEQYDAETHAQTLAQFYAAANPAAVLALIAENERLSGECEGCPMQVAEQLRIELSQLKAETAGLRTGYQAYERVNAELKAEIEGLRKRIDDLSPFKGAPLAGPDTKCLACGGYHSGLGGLPCPKMNAVAQALSMENQRITPVDPLRVPHPLEAAMGKGEQP